MPGLEKINVYNLKEFSEFKKRQNNKNKFFINNG